MAIGIARIVSDRYRCGDRHRQDINVYFRISYIYSHDIVAYHIYIYIAHVFTYSSVLKKVYRQYEQVGVYIINAFNRNYKYASLTYYMKRNKEYSKPNYKINIIKISAAFIIITLL